MYFKGLLCIGADPENILGWTGLSKSQRYKRILFNKKKNVYLVQWKLLEFFLG